MDEEGYRPVLKNDGTCCYPVEDPTTGIERRCVGHSTVGFFCNKHNIAKNGSHIVFLEPFGDEFIEFMYCENGHAKSANSQICRMCDYPSSDDDELLGG